MKKILSVIAILSVMVSANAQLFDRKSAELGIKMGMYIEKNKEKILSWSRLIAYKTLQNEAKKYDCEHKVKPSTNGASEYVRGLCTFVNEKNKQDVLEGLNALSYAVLHTYEDKKAESLCATSLAMFMSKNYKAAEMLSNQAKAYGSNSELCKTAQNIVTAGLKAQIFSGVEAGNVCVE